MRIAITDACIFIDLIEIRLTSEFFGQNGFEEDPEE